MDDDVDNPAAAGRKVRVRERKSRANQGGGAVYGLGLIGALVWYGQQAKQPGEYVLAVFKALLWPAFLTYEAFNTLHRLTTEGGSDAE